MATKTEEKRVRILLTSVLCLAEGIKDVELVSQLVSQTEEDLLTMLGAAYDRGYATAVADAQDDGAFGGHQA